MFEGETTSVHERRYSERGTVTIESSWRYYSYCSKSCQYLVNVADGAL